jgi:Uma2 family endonuclease
MGVSASLTFEEFEQIRDDGMKHELLAGEHVAVPPPKRPHTRVQQNLQDALRPYVRERQLGEVHIEAGFKLSPQSWLQPDVSFVRSAQMQRGDPDEYYENAPALAIEVASDSGTASQFDLKMQLYFAHGAEEVWIVYPKTRRVRAHFPDGRSETLSPELRSALFPGWSVALSAVFIR